MEIRKFRSTNLSTFIINSGNGIGLMWKSQSRTFLLKKKEIHREGWLGPLMIQLGMGKQWWSRGMNKVRILKNVELDKRNPTVGFFVLSSNNICLKLILQSSMLDIGKTKAISGWLIWPALCYPESSFNILGIQFVKFWSVKNMKFKFGWDSNPRSLK